MQIPGNPCSLGVFSRIFFVFHQGSCFVSCLPSILSILYSLNLINYAFSFLILIEAFLMRRNL